MGLARPRGATLRRPLVEKHLYSEGKEQPSARHEIKKSQRQFPSLRHKIMPPTVVFLLPNQTKPSFFVNPPCRMQ